MSGRHLNLEPQSQRPAGDDDGGDDGEDNTAVVAARTPGGDGGDGDDGGHFAGCNSPAPVEPLRLCAR